MLAWLLLGARPSAESLFDPWEAFGHRDAPKPASGPLSAPGGHAGALHEAFSVEDDADPA